MSDEQKNNSGALSPQNGSSPQQAETYAQKAEIVHPDGSREEVLLSAERFWSGALPRPEDFAKYADVVPDAPERILRMAEKEQQHRIDSEKCDHQGKR